MPASPDSPLKVGIVGAGAIVRERHAPGLLAIKGVEIVAVANHSRESAAAFCRDFCPNADVVEEWRDLVARADLDIIWIGTHPNLHREITQAALGAGKHVFCQARMAPDLAEAVEMQQAAQARPDLVTMLCPPPHGLYHDTFLRSFLQEKPLGIIRRARVVSRNGAFLDPHAPPHWRQLQGKSGLNILTLGIHTEVLQRWFGDITAVQASSRTWTPVRGGAAVEIPDDLLVVADFACGILGTLDLSGADPGPPIEYIEITGERGVLRQDYLTGEITMRNHGASETTVLSTAAPLQSPWQVERDFIRAVRNPETPRPHPDFRDGVAYMRVVQAVHESLHSGCKAHVRITV
jgi:predicted dehydrogenase